MGDQAALQEAIQRARQLAAKIAPQQPSSQPAIKRPASTIDGPIKVTLAYEKPVGKQNDQESRQRSTSRDHNRNERDSRDRDYKDTRDNSYNRESRDPSRDTTRNSGHSMLPHDQYSNSRPPHPPPRDEDDRIEIIIPHAVIGLVIGKGGENIKRIQNESGATVRVDPNTIDERGNKLCTITGTKAAVEEARIQVENVIESAGTNKRPRMQPESSDSYRLKIPASRTGAIIGKGGETIKSIKQTSGCDIELDKTAKDCGPDESVFIIRGSSDKILKARALIEARLASRSHRDGGMRDNSGDSHQNHSGRSSSKGVITGANAAPVSQGQFSEIPSNYPAATGQQNSADMTAAWAAYFAQYSTYYNQAGVQPGAPGAIPFTGQPNMMGAPGVASQPAVQPPSAQPGSDLDTQQSTADPSQATQGQQDFSNQWIEYYMSVGRPDYAEQIIQMKKQQQAQKQ